MNKIAACCLGLMLLLLVAPASDGAGRFMLAGVQSDRGQVGDAKSKAGYRIQVCVAPSSSQVSRSASRYVIHVGLFRGPVPRRNAAALWALYD